MPIVTNHTRTTTAAISPTLYWHPALVMPDGKALVTFDLADSITRYEVLVVSHTYDGRLGANRAAIIGQAAYENISGQGQGIAVAELGLHIHDGEGKFWTKPLNVRIAKAK